MFRLIRFLVIFSVLLVSSLYLFLLIVDVNYFKEPIEKELSTLLHREVKVERINLKMSLTPTLSVRGVDIKNSKEFDDKTSFAKVKEMELSFSLVPLFKGKIQLDDIILKGGKVVLIEKDGLNNWSFSAAEKNVPSKNNEMKDDLASDFSRYYFHYVGLKDIAVLYNHGELEESFYIQNVTFTQMKNAFIHFKYNDIPMQLMIASENLVPSLLSGFLSDFVFNVKLKDADLKVMGNIGNLELLKDIDLSFEGSISNLDMLLKSIFPTKIFPSLSQQEGTFSFYLEGDMNNLKVKELKSEFKDFGSLKLNMDAKNILSAPKFAVQGEAEIKNNHFAKKYGLQSAGINFDTSYENKTLLLNKIATFVNKTDIQLSGKVDFQGNVPVITGNVYSEYFNTEDIFVQDELETSSSKKTQEGKEEPEKIDVSFLNLFDANVKFKFENLKLFDNAYHKANIHLIVKEGVLDVNPVSLDLLSGNVNGVFQINSRVQPMDLSLSLKGVGLMISDLPEVKPYLKDSPANMHVELKTKGDTSAAFVDNLNGVIQLQIPRGVIVNKWFNSLPSAIGAVSKNSAFSYSGAEYYSKLSCAAMKLDVKDGVIKSDKNIALETSLINLAISGDIDLKKKYLTLSLIPSINQLSSKLNKKLSFAQYVKLEGPFSKIQMKEDVSGALQSVANKKLDDLAQKVAGIESVKEEEIAVGGLCRQALGLKNDTAPVEEKVQSNPQKTEKASSKQNVQNIKNSLEDQLKSQLEKSLTNILKKK